MNLLKPFDPEQMDFPGDGNLIGYFDGNVPVHLPDRDRVFRPLLITGVGDAMTRWIAGQMAQDANRRSGAVVCLDPGGRYAEAFARRVDKKDAKRVIWFDLDAPFGTGRTAGRVIPLNPCDPFNLHDEVDFAVFQKRLVAELGPLPPTAQAALDFALKAFIDNRSFDADRAFTLPALLTFLADADYRRYITSGLHPALLGRMPDSGDFEQAFPILAARLRPIFADPVWRATLGVTTNTGMLTAIPPAPIIIVTGEALTSSNPPAALWRHALNAHLRHILMRGEASQTLHLYGFGAGSLDDPGIERILARSASARTTVTLARDAYGESDHRPRLFFDQEIAFEPDAARMFGETYARSSDDLLFVQPHDRGGSFTLTLPPEPCETVRGPGYADILRRYGVFRYGRKLLYPLIEVDRLFTACNRDEALYDALDIPPPTAWRATYAKETDSLPPKKAKRRAILIDNPFRRAA